jgi:type I restriction enzyme, S subunit
MEIRPGYKLTVAGVIPADWEEAKLDDCLDLLTDFEANGSFEHVAQNVRVYDSEEFAWYVRATDLENETPLSKVRFVDRASYRFLKKTSLFGNEVLITKRGEIGKVYLFEKRSEYATLAPNLYLLKLNDSVLPAYVYAYFRYGNGNRTLKNINASTTLGALYKNDVKAIALPRPPVLEQRAIAAAVSDVDALLGGLDRLIAKKRDLKQAAMQQLLTCQTRLPGFHGEWEVKRLGEPFRFSGGYSASRDQLSEEGHCYLHYGDIHGSSKTTIDTNADFQDIPKLNIPLNRVSRDSLLEDGDVVFVDASEDDDGTSKHVVVINKDRRSFVSGLHTIVAKPNTDELAHEYRRYCFQTAAIQKQFLFYAVGTKVSGISKTNLAKLTLPVPSVPEQTAIAAVLSDMDAELAVLKARRDKTHALKQGMMQELLTGRTRLV